MITTRVAKTQAPETSTAVQRRWPHRLQKSDQNFKRQMLDPAKVHSDPRSCMDWRNTEEQSATRLKFTVVEAQESLQARKRTWGTGNTGQCPSGQNRQEGPSRTDKGQ